MACPIDFADGLKTRSEEGSAAGVCWRCGAVLKVGGSSIMHHSLSQVGIMAQYRSLSNEVRPRAPLRCLELFSASCPRSATPLPPARVIACASWHKSEECRRPDCHSPSNWLRSARSASPVASAVGPRLLAAPWLLAVPRPLSVAGRFGGCPLCRRIARFIFRACLDVGAVISTGRARGKTIDANQISHEPPMDG